MSMKNKHDRKCWCCGSVAEHKEDFAPEVCCKKCGSLDTIRITPKVPSGPTPAQIHAACISYRHDYGIMEEEARESLRLTAIEWARAWGIQ